MFYRKLTFLGKLDNSRKYNLVSRCHAYKLLSVIRTNAGCLIFVAQLALIPFVCGCVIRNQKCHLLYLWYRDSL